MLSGSLKSIREARRALGKPNRASGNVGAEGETNHPQRRAAAGREDAPPAGVGPPARSDGASPRRE